jgi:predicted DCC family thiol-disulfide oxidoreductase YuxK
MARDWLIWDGACGFCCWWIEWARRRGAEALFRIIPYQEAPSPPMTDALRARARRAVQVVTADGRELSAGRACLYVLERLGWGRWARLCSHPPFLWGIEVTYRIVARNRPFFGRFVSRDPRGCGVNRGSS